MTPQQANELPRLNGISRDFDSPSGAGILLSFERALSDDEMRSLHDLINRRTPAPTEPAVDRDAARLKKMIAWYLSEGRRADIDPHGHACQTTEGHILHWLDGGSNLDPYVRKRVGTQTLATPALPAVPELRLCPTPDELKAHLAAVPAVPVPAPLAPILAHRRFANVTGFFDADYVEFLEGATNGGGVLNGVPHDSLHYTRSEADANVTSGVWREIGAPQPPQASQPTSTPEAVNLLVEEAKRVMGQG